MRRLSAILLLLVFSSQLIIKGLVLLEWKLDQHVIATTLCVKKDKAINDCCGRCVLHERLDVIDHTPPLPSQTRLLESESKADIFCTPETDMGESTRKPPIAQSATLSPFMLIATCDGFLQALIQPPDAFV